MRPQAAKQIAKDKVAKARLRPNLEDEEDVVIAAPQYLSKNYIP